MDLAVVVKKRKIRVNLCFESRHHNMQTADDNKKVILQAIFWFFQIGITFQLNYYL